MSSSDDAPLRWVKYDGIYYAALLIPNSESPMTVPDKHCFVFFLDGESGAVVPESDVEPFDLDNNKERANHPAAAAGVALAEQILHGTSQHDNHQNNITGAEDGALGPNTTASNVHHREYDPTAVFAGNEFADEDAELEIVNSPDDNYNYEHKSHVQERANESGNSNVDDKHGTSPFSSHHRSHRHRSNTTNDNDDNNDNDKHERHKSRHKHKKGHRSHSRHNRVKQEEEEIEEEKEEEQQEQRFHSADSSIDENENENEVKDTNDKKELIDAEQLADQNDNWRELEEEYYNNNNTNNEENNEHDDYMKQETLSGPTYRRGKVNHNNNERRGNNNNNNPMSEALNALNSRGSLVSPYLAEIRYHYRELLHEAEQHGQLLNMQEADVVRNVEYILLGTAAKIKFLREVHEHNVSTSHTLSHAEKENAEHALNKAIKALQDGIHIEQIIRHMVQFVNTKKDDDVKPEVKRRPAHMERLAFHDASIAFMLRNTLTNAIPRELTYELANKYREQRVWRERQLQRNHGLGKTGFFAIPKPMERWSRARELMVLAHAPENQPVKPTGYTSRHYSETINKVQQNAIKRFTGQSSRQAKNKSMTGNASNSVRETNLYSSQIPAFMTTANNLIANTLAAASINLNNTTNSNSAMAAFQTQSRRPGQNYPAYYNFHDLTPSSANDVEQYRANNLASANGVLEPMNLVDNYFTEHSLPLEQEQEPLITPLHMSVDPSIDFAISPDEVREERLGGNNDNSHVPSNSQSYMYSASIRLPSQESHFYSVESSVNPDNYNSSEAVTNTTLDASHPLYSVNYNDDIGGVPQPTTSHHHHHHHHHHSSHSNRHKNQADRLESRASLSHYTSSRASSLASSHHRSHSASRSHSRHKTRSMSRHSHHTHKRRHSQTRTRTRTRTRSLSHVTSASEKTNDYSQHHTTHHSSKRKEQHKMQSNSLRNTSNNKNKKLDWRESAKRAILEQLTLYLRGLKGKPAVISYDHFESIARKLLERAVSRESERTGISMALQANNQSVPFLRETEMMLKRSVDTYVKRHFMLSSRHTSAKHSVRHRSAAQAMSQPHYDQIHEYPTTTNNNNNSVRKDANDESNYHRGAEDSPVYDEASREESTE